MKKICTFFIIFILIINNQSGFASADANPGDEIRYSINKTAFFETYAPYQLVKINESKAQMWYLSFIVPGLGQIMMGETVRGFIYLLGFIIFVPITTLLIMSQLDYSSKIYPDGSRGQFGIPVSFMWVSIGLTSIIYIINVIDAYIFKKEIETTNGAFMNSLKVIQSIHFKDNNISYRLLNF